MRIDVLTLFPNVFEGFLGESMIRIAREKGALDVRLHDIRDWATDNHRSVDDKPYGGGHGMVLKVDVVVPAVEAVLEECGKENRRVRTIMMTPQGRPMSQALARELSEEKNLVLLCGHYEGFDERIRELLEPEEISIGDFVTSGGEAPAMCLIDAVARLLDGVLGEPECAKFESFSEELDGMLEYPQYTRPPVYRDVAVPEVLTSGNHAEIEKWRREMSMKNTGRKRSDLLKHTLEFTGDEEE
ncbi:MAG: tRNA (guanosine(37)-N1)-methyltransferase TrmD [Planctomycetota bacterium]|nr:MAG: tRNA (guanosine(37)-N1)-methyltransferase TrmD [Planctomycetota bacterium]